MKISLIEKKLIPSPTLEENTHVLMHSPLVFDSWLNSATARIPVSFVIDENSILEIPKTLKYSNKIAIPD
ncbi:putative D ORF F [Vaccinia virus]|nr:putative D ORF F [Vaccinia virus]